MIGKLIDKYAEVDPRIYILTYHEKERRKKSKAITFDPITREQKKEILKMWGRKSWYFNFYNTVGDKSKIHCYCPDPWFVKYFDAKMNDWKVCAAVDDKCFYDYYFPDVCRPKTIVKICGGHILDDNSRPISLSEAVAKCRAIGSAIIKPSVGTAGGRGIYFWKEEGDISIESLLREGKNVVVQELIEQHPVLSVIHPNSVNSVRLMTLTTEKEVSVMSSILRMGVGTAKVDNVSSGGIAVGIDECGLLKSKAFSGGGEFF